MEKAQEGVLTIPSSVRSKTQIVWKEIRGSFLLIDEEGQERQRPLKIPIQAGGDEKRKCTDVFGIFLIGIAIISMIVLCIHCFEHADIQRIHNGYNSCGFLCGTDNEMPEDGKLVQRAAEYGPVCSKNNSDKPYVVYEKSEKIVYDPRNLKKSCKKECPSGHTVIGNNCYPPLGDDIGNTIMLMIGHENFFLEMAEDLSRSWDIMGYVMVSSMVGSILTLLFLSFYAHIAMVIVMVGALAISAGTSLYFWACWYETSNEEGGTNLHKKLLTTYLWASLGSTAVTINVGLVILPVSQMLDLVSLLFKESGKTCRQLPGGMVIAVLTSTCICFIMALGIYTTVWIESAGHLGVGEVSAFYEKDNWILYTRWYNFIMASWFIFTVIGFQEAVIAESVARWYFTRDKSTLERTTTCNSVRLNIRYHLGSIVVFSWFVSFLKMLQVFVIKVKIASATKRALCKACVWCMGEYLTPISQNAYITMSLHGTNFYKSSKESYHLIVSHKFILTAIALAAHQALSLFKLVVVLISLAVGFLLNYREQRFQHMWIILLMTLIVSFAVAHCFMAIYSTIISTVFICCCYDSRMNDGQEKPYFMTEEFIVILKKAHDLQKGQSKEDLKARRGKPKEELRTQKQQSKEDLGARKRQSKENLVANTQK